MDSFCFLKQLCYSCSFFFLLQGNHNKDNLFYLLSLHTGEGLLLLSSNGFAWDNERVRGCIWSIWRECFALRVERYIAWAVSDQTLEIDSSLDVSCQDASPPIVRDRNEWQWKQSFSAPLTRYDQCERVWGCFNLIVLYHTVRASIELIVLKKHF